jgi:hypothetical protein
MVASQVLYYVEFMGSLRKEQQEDEPGDNNSYLSARKVPANSDW